MIAGDATAYGGASGAAGGATPSGAAGRFGTGHSLASDGGGRILALDSAFKSHGGGSHGPRKLQMPHQGHSNTADMVERIVNGLDQPAGSRSNS